MRLTYFGRKPRIFLSLLFKNGMQSFHRHIVTGDHGVTTYSPTVTRCTCISLISPQTSVPYSYTREAARYRRTPLGVVRRTCADVFGIALHIGLSPLFSVVSLCVGCFSRCSVIILDWVYNCPVVCLATLNNCAIVITSFITLLYNFVIIAQRFINALHDSYDD